MQLFHVIIFLQSPAILLTFESCKSSFNFWAIFLKVSLFSVWFVAIFCIYSQVLSMHHSDSDADSKLYYVNTACKRDFMLHSSSWWFWYFSEDIVQKFDKVILLKSRIISQLLMLMQIIYTWNFLMYKFSNVLASRHFHGFHHALCMIHENHIQNILQHQEVPCEYDSMFGMLFIWWYHVVILWNQQSHNKCFRSVINVLKCIFSICVVLTIYFFNLFLFLNLLCDFCLLLPCSFPYHRDFGVEKNILIW